eukprot:XP_011612403.1 PREDICTED: uncharacterized protein LOC105417860 isoform X2 [Takifugu rubripes]
MRQILFSSHLQDKKSLTKRESSCCWVVFWYFPPNRNIRLWEENLNPKTKYQVIYKAAGLFEMEEAYSKLYQQFLHLRTLCLRQAALLHQLTKTLQDQKHPDNPSMETPEHLQEKPGSSSHNLTAADGFSQNMKMFSDLLTTDMSKLAVDRALQTSENQELAQNVPPLRSLEPFRCPGGNGGLSTNMVDIFSSQPDGMLMSDVALQSHICDFCQAVFPGDTSTRGDFLRHLYTHIT